MISRWRTTTTVASNAAAAATQEEDATTSSSRKSATAPTSSSSSGVPSSQFDPSSATSRLDEEFGDSGPSSPPGSTNRRNLSDRLQLSPASRTAITIRTMAGVGVDDEEEGDDDVRSEDEGVSGSDGGGSGTGPSPGHQSPGRPPPAPSWRFSVGAVVVGEDAAALAAAAPVDEEANDGESGPLSGPAAEQEVVPEVELPEGLLADPVHLHSFVPDSSLFRPLWGTVRRCAGCGDRLRTLFGGTSGGGGGNGNGGGNGDASSGSDGQTVRCAACGVLAHRGCAFSSRSIKRRGTGDATTMPVCETNAPLVEALERKTSPLSSSRRRRRRTEEREDDNGGEETDAAADEDGRGQAASGHDKDAEPPVSADDADPTAAPPATATAAFGGGGGGLGAPFQSLSRILQENVAAIFDGNKQKREEEDQEGDGENGIKEDAKDPVIWKGESSVADRADAVKRDERVLAEIERRLSSDSDASSSSKEDGDVEIVSKGKRDSSKESAKVSLALLDEARTDRPPAPTKPRSAIGSALDLVRTTQRTQSNVRIASVAGSIAGGVAGLAIAGPAGAMIGAKLFQTAGVLGVLIDGTMGVGVIVAGATMGGKVAENISSGERVLRIGGSKGKEAADGLVLVRPNVVVDPVWEDLTAEAKRSAPSHATGGGAFGFVANHRRKTAEMEHRDRLKKDADNIVSADEYEIPAEEKVVLLVSSGLNDRHSLPGHVHQCLVSEYFRRSKERRDEALKNPGSRDKRGDRIKEPLLALARDDPSDASDPDRIGGERCPYRAARRDCHGVIRHVTATLLEVRPAFASSPRLAERTAAAVEALVFGELYADVFGEISEECREADERLLKKIGSFEAEAQRRTDRRRRRRSASPVDGGEAAEAHGGEGDDRSPEDDDKEEAAPAPAPAPPPSSGVRSEDISVGALGALLRLPEATTPADKLALCVEFLECVSVHFSSPPASSSGESGGGDAAPRPKAKPAGADNLLKMVCEHVLVAKVPRLNAELTFLEEFARDEQLLRGREGYALVTLQAALHYLNASDDLERDIFRHCGG